MLPIDTDFGRDLYEMSNIFLDKIVWLGPRLSHSITSSPLYYYLYYPSLWLSHGNMRGPIYFNMLLAAMSLGIFLYVLFKQNKQRLLLILSGLVIITTQPWISLATHPGNGFSYALFVMAGLATTYYTNYLWVSALLFGIATSMHPASLLALPIMIGAYLATKPNIKQIVLGLFAYVLPWAPIILFEIITKGFLFRQWMMNPGTGLVLSNLNFGSLAGITNQLGLRSIWIVLLLQLFISFDRKVNFWEKITLGMGLLFFSLLKNAPGYYLFGISIAYLYVIVKWLWQKKFMGIVIMLLWLTLNIFTKQVEISPIRPLQTIEQNVNVIATMPELKDKKVAIVAVLPSGTEVPQADDYRGLLRFQGINVVELPDHSQADVMVYVVENPGFDYQHWSTWESELFGAKKLLKTKQLENAILVVWERI